MIFPASRCGGSLAAVPLGAWCPSPHPTRPSCPPSLPRGCLVAASRLPPAHPRSGSAPRVLPGVPTAATGCAQRRPRYHEGSDSCPRSPPPAGLPAYLASPSYRSAPNHVMPPTGRFPRQPNAGGEFQTSPSPSRLVTAPRRNGFVILRTNTSPPAALHPASRRRSCLRLRRFSLRRHGLPPC